MPSLLHIMTWPVPGKFSIVGPEHIKDIGVMAMLKVWIVNTLKQSVAAVTGWRKQAPGLALALCCSLLLPAEALAQSDSGDRPFNSGPRFGRGQTADFSSSQSSTGIVDDGKTPLAEFHMARMVYQDGGARGRGRWGFSRGWWAIDYPQAELHFHGGVDRLTNVDMAEDSHHIDLMDPALFDHPWLFVQQIGQGGWNPTSEEAANLREYLYKGGFLVIDDFHSEREWPVMVNAMSKVLPGHPIVELSPDRDEVFHVLYDLDTLTQIPGQRHLRYCGGIDASMEGMAKWSGIFDDNGRLMVAIDFNVDMGDAWEHADDPCYPEPMTALAYRFGINYLIYAMTH